MSGAVDDNVVAVSVDTHTVALKADGTVVAWGDNRSGATNTPAGLSNVVMVSAMCGLTIALKSDGTVVAWGNDFAGGTRIPQDLSNAVAVAAGCGTSFILRADGTVHYVGNHTNTLIAGLSNVVAIAPEYGVGGAAWAIQSDGSVIYSRLSAFVAFTNSPVLGLSNVVAVSGGRGAGGVLALQRHGTVVNLRYWQATPEFVATRAVLGRLRLAVAVSLH